jgi:formamidopyrimidine-DNA glycosylase
MLELPESSTIARQLNETIKGKEIKFVEANKSPHKFAWYSGNPDDYDTLLSGKRIGCSSARGGMVEIEAEEFRILLCDGATPKFHSDYRKAPIKHQLYIEFTDDSALVATVQMYGGLYVFKEGQNDNPYYLGACAKPSPLSDEFTYEYFCSLYTDNLSNKSVKAFLATEQRMPGVGNGVLQDILFKSGNHPKRKMNTLSEDELHNLYTSVRSVLGEMTVKGGRDTEKDLYGNQGGYLSYLSKNTYMTPCTKCGYEIRRESFLGGNIYFCEHCQKEA